MKELQKFSWDEVTKHNSTEDCWIVVEREVDGVKKGLVLDITNWAPRHPGGSIIYDGAGGDCTIMFWTYHPLSLIDNSSSYINKLIVGEIENYKCLYELGTPFHRTLKQRVEDKITADQRRSDWRMWAKSAIITLVIMLSFWFGWIKGSTLAVFIFGLGVSQTGLNMMHDGIHMAYSRSKLVCALAAFTFNLVGCNSYAYRKAHAFGHHAYTNHLEYDTGILGSFPVLRLHDKLPRSWFHVLQHVYVVPIYVFSIVIFWLLDYEDMTTFYNYPKRQAFPRSMTWAITAMGKLFFVSWYIALQFYLHDWRTSVLHCTIFMIAQGFFALIFFVVNHWTDKAVMITNEHLKTYTGDWAILQILASSNFAIKSFFWTHISGGLNLQIEHHLFPAIIHTRLPDVTPILRQTCMEFGINYDDQCYTTFWAALASNFRFLKDLGSGVLQSKFPVIKAQKHA